MDTKTNNTIRRKSDIYMQYKYDFRSTDKELKEDFRKFNDSLSSLHAEAEVFYTADKEGKLPVMTGRNKNMLLGCYKAALDHGNTLLRTALKKGLGSVTAFYHTVENTMKTLAADAESLHAAEPDREMTLPEITADSGMQIIELKDNPATAALPVKVKLNGENGPEVTTGVFRAGNGNRNGCAMNAVAGLLGMQDVITKEVPMKIRTAEGWQTGIFTEAPKGSDPVQTAESDPILQVTGRALNDSFEAVRKLSDLQVLDFLCSFERAGKNIFLQTKDGMLTGISGTGNNASFDGFGDYSDTLFHMRFINEKTAALIRDLSPEMLTAVLTHHRLRENAIKNTCSRLNFLKNSLDDCFVRTENPEIFPDNSANAAERLDGRKLYILNKEQTAGLKMNHLSCFDSETWKPANLFGQVEHDMTTLRKHYLKGLCRNALQAQRGTPADGISTEDWQKILTEYHHQADRFCALILSKQEKSALLPKETIDTLAALSEKTDRLPPSAAGMEQMKVQLAAAAEKIFACLETTVPDQDNLSVIMTLHEMINLSEKAAGGICSPAFRANDHAAQRILGILAEQKPDEILARMNDHEQYNNAMNNIERGLDFNILTAGKSAYKMNTLLCSTRTDFISSCRRALKTTPAIITAAQADHTFKSNDHTSEIKKTIR